MAQTPSGQKINVRLTNDEYALLMELLQRLDTYSRPRQYRSKYHRAGMSSVMVWGLQALKRELDRESGSRS